MKFLRSLSRRALSSKGLKDRSESTRTVSLEEELRSVCRVRFSADPPTFHENACQLEDKDLPVLWYNSDDIEVFQQDSVDQVHQLAEHDDDNDNGILSRIIVAHSVCQTINTRQQMEALMAKAVRDATQASSSSCPPSSITMVGLEKWMTSELQKARVQQRQQFLRTLKRLQAKKASSSSPLDKESEIRSASVKASQPARLFAQYLGVLFQHAEEK
mmetsp:Transcript_1701/g.3316  ORF Transcript_1701/g.3316 Transcript_1701/m.3316 type:complete len:216 (+) Transcript_1701:66-713(+)